MECEKIRKAIKEKSMTVIAVEILLGYVSATLVMLVLRWLCWYYFACYPLAKC